MLDIWLLYFKLSNKFGWYVVCSNLLRTLKSCGHHSHKLTQNVSKTLRSETIKLLEENRKKAPGHGSWQWFFLDMVAKA